MDGDLANSSFGNSTESPPFEFNDYTQRVIVAVMFLIVILLGSVGNTLVILAVVLSKKLRTATNAFVVNLSVADLLTCTVLPIKVLALLSTNSSPVSEWVCSVSVVVQVTAVICSVYTLAFIALQRLVLIKWSTTKYPVIYTQRKIAMWLAASWSIPLLVTLIPQLADVGAAEYNKQYHLCTFSYTHPHTKYIKIIMGIGFYPIPLITILICYVLIWKHLRNHTKNMKVTAPEPLASSMTTHMTVYVDTVNSNHTTTSTARNPPQGTSHKSQVCRHQTEITKNMFYVVCAFILCLAPYPICKFLDNSGPFRPYALAIGFFNSCINPLIYATKYRDFKTVFRCILRRKWEDIPEPSDFLKTLISAQMPCRGGSRVFT